MITSFLNESHILNMMYIQTAVALFIPAFMFCLLKVFED